MAPYAIIDTATTGLHPEGGHRVKELAIVTTDDQFNETGTRFETVIDPEREFDLRHIDGITPVHMIGARPFRHYAWQVARALDGHVLVAHCLRFHAGFTSDELRAAGIVHDVGRGVCTLELAGASQWPLSRYDAMAYLGIGWQGSRGQSLPEALGCLELARIGDSMGAPLGGQPFRLIGSEPAGGETTAPVLRARGDAAVDTAEHARLHLRSIPDAGSAEFNYYLYVVSTHLSDGTVDDTDWQDLEQLRGGIDMSPDQATSLHLRYIKHVAQRAAADGLIDEGEWSRIRTVGQQLRISPDVGQIIDRVRADHADR